MTLPEPDADGRWLLGGHFALHLDGDLAVIRAKWGPVATIPVDDLQHIGDVMHAAAHACQKEKK